MGRNYYDILGVPKNADEDQLKKGIGRLRADQDCNHD